MADWIAFEEREPTASELAHGIWVAYCQGVNLNIWNKIPGRPFTHFREVEAPSDLPPKPLPKLPDGAEWRCGAADVVRYCWRDFVMVNDTVSVSDMAPIVTFPASIVDALRERERG